MAAEGTHSMLVRMLAMCFNDRTKLCLPRRVLQLCFLYTVQRGFAILCFDWGGNAALIFMHCPFCMGYTV